MPSKFHGSLDEIKAAVATTGIKGDWSSDAGGRHTFRSVIGGVMNWWESKGTLQFQGVSKAKDDLESAVAGVLSSTDGLAAVTNTVPAPPRSQQIFIVHGHDTETRDQLELALRRLGLEPYILMNTSGGGKTIIEALEGKIGHDYSSDFGIVLMTPDDIGYAQQDGPDKAEPRARQNVVLETGMLLSSLTRNRMALVVKGHIELPSDLQGIIRIGFNHHIREVVPKLCQRLKEVGFHLDAQKIAEAAS